jgi:hypothetical protein
VLNHELPLAEVLGYRRQHDADLRQARESTFRTTRADDGAATLQVVEQVAKALMALVSLIGAVLALFGRRPTRGSGVDEAIRTSNLPKELKQQIASQLRILRRLVRVTVVALVIAFGLALVVLLTSFGPEPQRFTDNHTSGTVTDNLTGLTWLRNANCFSLRTWTDAKSDAEGLESGSCGLQDGSRPGHWRLPTANELESLIDFNESNSALPQGNPFAKVVPAEYWTSTRFQNASNLAWYVDLGAGGLNGGGMTIGRYVWPVHGRQWPASAGTPIAP